MNDEDMKTPEAVTEPEAPKKGKAKKNDSGETKAVVAGLNTWEPQPTTGGAPKEVIDHGNGITAYHY